MVNALKKILTSLLIKEYPKIKDIHVSGDEYGYSIGIFLKYNDMADLSRDEILKLKEDVRHFSKYILGGNERVNHIYFYEPHNY
jgi:hypothetical protein